MPTAGRQAAQKKYNAKPVQVARRMARNRARTAAVAAGKVTKGDGKDVAHKDNNPHNNKPSNHSIQSPAKNRSFKRNAKAGRA